MILRVIFVFSGCLESLQWKEGADSSGSDTGKQELDDDFPQDTQSLSSNVQFTVGDRSIIFINLLKHNHNYTLPSAVTFKTLHIHPHSVFMCFICVS